MGRAKGFIPSVGLACLGLLAIACGDMEDELGQEASGLLGLEYDPSSTRSDDPTLVTERGDFELDPGPAVPTDPGDLVVQPGGPFVIDPTLVGIRNDAAYICKMSCGTDIVHVLVCATVRTTSGETACIDEADHDGCDLLSVSRDSANDSLCGL